MCLKCSYWRKAVCIPLGMGEVRSTKGHLLPTLLHSSCPGSLKGEQAGKQTGNYLSQQPWEYSLLITFSGSFSSSFPLTQKTSHKKEFISVLYFVRKLSKAHWQYRCGVLLIGWYFEFSLWGFLSSFLQHSLVLQAVVSTADAPCCCCQLRVHVDPPGKCPLHFLSSS